MATIAQDREGACKTFRWQSCTLTQQLGIEQLGLTSRVSCASQPKIRYHRGYSQVQATSSGHGGVPSDAPLVQRAT